MRSDIRFTYEEYQALPETGPRYQLVDGDLIMSPAPSFRHQDILAELSFLLGSHVRSSGLGKLLFAPLDVILSDEDVFQPDIVYISNARRSIIVPEGLRGTPDLCVEILSPSNKNLDLKTKRLLYARFGLPELWIVDPDANTAQVFRLQEDPNQPIGTYSQNETLTSPSFPGFSLELAKVFSR
ncbi:MAG TPA: Uma2 family endonuclease [Planctomycetota bacterium]|nr:Uma2 family endonuclease [Planctomycetota bacterium]